MRRPTNPRFSMLQGVPGALMPQQKPSRARKKAKTPEGIIQAQADAYLDLCGLFYIRFPDWLMAAIMTNPHIPIHVKAAISDILKGMPDNLILRDGRYLPAELKTSIGTLSASQKDVQREIGTVVYRSFEEFQAGVDQFRGIK